MTGTTWCTVVHHVVPVISTGSCRWRCAVQDVPHGRWFLSMGALCLRLPLRIGEPILRVLNPRPGPITARRCCRQSVHEDGQRGAAVARVCMGMALCRARQVSPCPPPRTLSVAHSPPVRALPYKSGARRPGPTSSACFLRHLGVCRSAPPLLSALPLCDTTTLPSPPLATGLPGAAAGRLCRPRRGVDNKAVGWQRRAAAAFLTLPTTPPPPLDLARPRRRSGARPLRRPRRGGTSSGQPPPV